MPALRVIRRSLMVIALSAAGVSCGDRLETLTTIHGDVQSVSRSSSASVSRSGFSLSALLLVSPAFAQSCEGVGVLACAVSPDEAGNPETRCGETDPETCRFSIELRVVQAPSVFFVEDSNSNRRLDTGEAVAELANDLGPVCNGSRIALQGVAVDFRDGSATAQSVVRERDAC